MTSINPMPLDIRLQKGLTVEWNQKADIMTFRRENNGDSETLFVLLRPEQELLERFLKHHLHIDDIYRNLL